MANLNTNLKERGSALIIILIVLLIGGAGAFFYMSKNGDLDLAGLASGESSDSASSEEADAKDNPVVVKVDGKKFRRQDVVDMMNTVPPQLRQMPPEQLYPMVVEQMINNQVIDKRASKAGLGRDKDVKEQLAKVKEQIIRAKFLENTLQENMDEARLKAEYDQYVESYKAEEEVRASHILVGEEKVAKDLIKKLGKGEAFEELAKENSLDGSGQNGGDLGFFTKAEVVPEFAKAAFSLEPGKYTSKPVKSNYGFHIIRVDEKRMRPADSFEQMKPVIEQNLRRVVYEEVLADWKKESKIERFDINGEPLAEEEPAAGEADDSAEGADVESEGEDSSSSETE